MSIEAAYRRVTPKEFARLKSDAKAAKSFFGLNLEDLDDPMEMVEQMLKQRRSRRYLSIGTDWHVLHFLLTGDSVLGEKGKPPPPPLGNVVQGGTKTRWPCTYGKVRFLTPAQVRAVAKALTKISVNELRSRFSVESFNVADIYPHGRRKAWCKDAAESAFRIYPRLVKFFQAAARDSDVILLSSD
jgi:hypothetical protein